MNCLICKKEFLDLKTFPFCSEKCRMVDLYNWFSGEYAIDDSEELSVIDDRETPEKFWSNEGEKE